MSELKTCTRCLQEMPLNLFTASVHTKSGYGSRCLECEKIRKRQRYWDNRERLLKQAADYRHAHPERRKEIERASRSKNKARYRPIKNARQSIRNRLVQGKQFLILPKELKRLYSLPCANCGDTSRPSIDHIIPLSRGGNHSIGNLMTLCLSCNVSKGKKTLTEWMQSKKMLGVG